MTETAEINSTAPSLWVYVTDLRLFYWSKRTAAKRRSEVRELTYNPYLGVETATILMGMLTLFLTLVALCKIRRCIRRRWRSHMKSGHPLSEPRISATQLDGPQVGEQRICTEEDRLASTVSFDRIPVTASDPPMTQRVEVYANLQRNSTVLIPIRRLSRSSDAIFLPRERSIYRALREGERPSVRDMKEGEPSSGRDLKEDEPSSARALREHKPSPARDMKEGEPSSGRDLKETEPSSGRDLKEGEPSSVRDLEEGKPSCGRDLEEGKPSCGRDLREGEPSSGKDLKEGEFSSVRDMREGESPFFTYLKKGEPSSCRTLKGGESLPETVLREGKPLSIIALSDDFVSPPCRRVIRFRDQFEERPRAVTEPPDGLRILALHGSLVAVTGAPTTVRSSSLRSLLEP